MYKAQVRLNSGRRPPVRRTVRVGRRRRRPRSRERLVQLPHTYYLNDYAQSHANLPRGAAIQKSTDGLSRRCLYMCSLNQVPKLDPALYKAWLNTLRRSASGGPPCTRLWLLKFPESAEAWLQQEAAAHSSPPPRSVAPWRWSWLASSSPAARRQPPRDQMWEILGTRPTPSEPLHRKLCLGNI